MSSDAAAPPAPKSAVATVRTRTSRPSQIITLIAVVVPFFGVLSAAGLLWGVALSWLDLVLFGVMYFICGLGITAGFHRLFSHRAFQSGKPVRAAFAIAGCMACQGPLTQWVTDHRKHHAMSDKEGDPHSPHGHGEGWRGIIGGAFHAHMGWLFHTKGLERGDVYGKDLFREPLIRMIDRFYLVWVALGLLIPFLVALAVTGSVDRGVQAFVWAGLVRIFVFDHATWSVNSICHMFGRRRFETSDQSRNHWLVAMLVFGEGWHNNHHAFPGSARHGLNRYQLDVSWLVIRGLEKLGLVWNVKLPTPERIARREAAAAPPAA